MLLLHEIEGLLVLPLLRQYFHVELAEVCVDLKSLLFHKFQKQQVCDVEEFGLEP